MQLVTDFEILAKKILDKYDNLSITMGILIADYRQAEAREYILNYLNRFDEKSGKYIDFYLPGYYLFENELNDSKKKMEHHNICVSKHRSSDIPVFVKRTGENYYFDDYLFEDFLREVEVKMGVAYTYNPMLLLVEVNKANARSQLQFQRKLVIELDNDQRGIKRAGCLFDYIFAIAKREVNLDRFGKEINQRYIKNGVTKKIAQLLDGNLFVVIEETSDQMIRCRIK